METKIEKLNKLKKEKDAVILSHYYTLPEVQEAADYIGDSFYLAKLASTLKNKTIVLCGVYFMGESAKIISPNKTVLIPDETADCPMAHMSSVEKIKKVKEEYDDVAVVCYVNSEADLKAASDVCVTSSNAYKIVKSLPNKNIYFVPDKNLAHYISKKLPDKNFIFNDGYCYVHEDIKPEEVQSAKEKYPNASVLAHPECNKTVLAFADFIGSTSEIIEYVDNSTDEEFIICTETGILHKLKEKHPSKKFYTANNRQICTDMKKITLDKIINSLENNAPEIMLSAEFIQKAHSPLDRMIELSK